jgi:alpha-L-fucosidase
MTRRTLLKTPLAAAAPLGSISPEPYGALPSPRQLRRHRWELSAFLHFTVNTFTDREWGLGDEDAALFNPTAFNADAIIDGLRAGGFQAVILTCKHHDGFCLWPTRATEHCIRNSPWRDGKGDVVREISAAARRQGLQFGIYVSPWDRNNPHYGKPEYIRIYREQLNELLTGYGPIFEVWHDGANGGDGYYGGAREKRIIDKQTYYQWPATWELVRSLQPDAVIFSDAGPDLRWVGNEKGIADDPCWATFAPAGTHGGPGVPGDTKSEEAATGHRHGSRWMPAECDVSIRPGWFWHERENALVKSPDELLNLYLKSVGRGAHLLLNVPPDRRGLLHENDLASLSAFGQRMRGMFRENIAAHAMATASNERASGFSASNLIDGRPSTFWSTDDAVTAAEVTLKFQQRATIQLIRLREHIALGQRVDSFALDSWQDSNWQILFEGTSIGPCRLIPLTTALITDKIRLRITAAQASPTIEEFSVFAGVPALAASIVRENIEWLDAWLPDTNQHSLPRILLVGDSITRSYTKQVEANLKDKAYVARLATSKSLGDPALLDQVALILREQSFDVIHFNNGMHGDGYTEEEYGAALPGLLEILRRLAPRAKLMWASTTDVRVKNNIAQIDSKTDRIVHRNQIAAALMTRRNIPIDDLFSVVKDHGEYHAEDGVHFNQHGIDILAAQVSSELERLLR